MGVGVAWGPRGGGQASPVQGLGGPPRRPRRWAAVACWGSAHGFSHTHAYKAIPLLFPGF